MAIQSHRLKTEEKKVYRKLFISLGIFLFSVVILFYAGIPILTQMIIFLTGNRSDNTTLNTSNSVILKPPVFDPLAEATNSATINISGMAQSESSVKISVNDIETMKVSADKDDKFTAKNVKLTEGTNTITATTLVSDKESSPSTAIIIIYKKNPPSLEITAPNDGQKFIAETKNISITGKTEPGSKITINNRFVIVNQEGKFDYAVNLNPGDNSFKIISTDVAGNQTTIERKVSYTP